MQAAQQPGFTCLAGCFPGCCRRECLPFAVLPEMEQKENQQYYERIRTDLSRIVSVWERKKPYYQFEIQSWIYDLLHTLLFYFTKKEELLEYRSAEPVHENPSIYPGACCPGAEYRNHCHRVFPEPQLFYQAV